MSILLQAKDVVRIGLTCTQTFFLVGRNLSKKICRFVKTDSIKTAISTLLAIEGAPCLVEDIRVDEGALKVWTSQGIKRIASAKVRCFLARYNRLKLEGCSSQCNCQEEQWAHFCIHKIAEHLTSVKEKVSAILQIAKKTTRELINDVTNQLIKENLDWSFFEEDDDSFFEVQGLGYLIITSQSELSVISKATGEKELNASTIAEAFDLLKSSESCLPFYFITSGSVLCKGAENL